MDSLQENNVYAAVEKNNLPDTNVALPKRHLSAIRLSGVTIRIWFYVNRDRQLANKSKTINKKQNILP